MTNLIFFFDILKLKAFLTKEKEGIEIGKVNIADENLTLFLRTNDQKIKIQKMSQPKNKMIPILKSNLQKQIRRFDGNSVNTFVKLFDIYPFEALRRLIMISCEDSDIYKETSVICWLMCASSKGYVINEKIKQFLIEYVISITYNLECIYLKEIRFNTRLEPNLKILDVYLQNKYISAILVRNKYGGLPQDLPMLSKTLHHYLQEGDIPKIEMLEYKEKIKEPTILWYALDFHVYPYHLTLLHKKYPQYSEDMIRRTIWKMASGVNYRLDFEPQEDYKKIWKEISEEYLRQCKKLLIDFS